MSKMLNILIEGDYIDSFIYSGVLFLVDSNLILRAYSWQGVFDRSISNLNFAIQFDLQKYAKGQILKINDDLKQTFSISQEVLSEYEFCSKELFVWPSDINIYKSIILFFVSENNIKI